MMMVEMSEESKAMSLREIQTIQSDVWDLKSSTVSDLDYRINEIDRKLDNFIENLESELTEYED